MEAAAIASAAYEAAVVDSLPIAGAPSTPPDRRKRGSEDSTGCSVSGLTDERGLAFGSLDSARAEKSTSGLTFVDVGVAAAAFFAY